MSGSRMVQILRDLHAWVFDGFAHRSYSQEGEDMILRRVFDGRKDGFYVDVGAHHPMRFSNTFYFYRLGWRGINIEPNPDATTRFRLFRPRDTHVQAGVGDTPATLRYWCFEDAALNTFDAQLAARYRADPRLSFSRTREIAVERLDAILSRCLPKGVRIDFLSIDVEGMDMAVLRSNDWRRFRPHCVLAEVIGATLESLSGNDVVRFLDDRGYGLYAKSSNTLVFRDRESQANAGLTWRGTESFPPART
jgi:FkbM family methyltransferase